MRKLELSREESAYLRGLLKEHLEYYRILAGNEKCTTRSRKLFDLINGLMLKLGPQ